MADGDEAAPLLDNKGDWLHGIFSCCEEGAGKCITRFFCMPCVSGSAYQSAFGDSALFCCLCAPFTICCNRSRIRELYQIKEHQALGGACGDACTSFFCGLCASLQHIREIENRRQIEIAACGNITPMGSKSPSKKKKANKKKTNSVTPISAVDSESKSKPKDQNNDSSKTEPLPVATSADADKNGEVEIDPAVIKIVAEAKVDT